MSLFDEGPSGTLEDVLGKQADDKVNSISNVYAKKRRQSIAQNAHSGRLLSGVSNYDAGDINAAEAGDIGDVYSGLAGALGQVPIDDYSAEQDDQRNRELAQLIAKLNKPSLLQEVLGGVSTAGNLAAKGAAFF
jgi:hypothetical protein